MARSTTYRRTVSDLVSWRQDQALNATILILRNFGPTGFLLHEEQENKNFKVFLGDPHNCTCPNFHKDKDLCQHICWLLLKKYKLSRENPITWQLGLVEREINEVLRGPANSWQKRTEAPKNETNDSDSTENSGVEQRPISEDDVCPICQDDLLAARLPVTYCRTSCGNSVHIKCMKVWADHQRKQQTGKGPNDAIMCPVCRGDFAPFALLMQELQGSGARFRKPEIANNVHKEKCSNCQMDPVSGKLYRCQTCHNLFLCQKCFNLSVHPVHPFEFKERRNGGWHPAVSALPGPVVGALQSRELQAEDYDLLQQLLDTSPGSELTQTDVQRLPGQQLRNGSRMIGPGRQCRLCLMNFQNGDFIRRLPDCKHVFHAACIDPLLLHRRAACPIDGRPVVPSHAAPHSQTHTAPAPAPAPGPSLAVSGRSYSLTNSGVRLPPQPLNHRLPPIAQRTLRHVDHQVIGQLCIGGAQTPPVMERGRRHGRPPAPTSVGFGAHTTLHGGAQRARSLSAGRRTTHAENELRLESRTITATRNN